MKTDSDLRKGAIVPDVSMVGKDVLDIAQLALLDILLDWVQPVLLADLIQHTHIIFLFIP